MSGKTEVTPFGTLPDGEPVALYTVRDGVNEATFSDFGARIVSVKVPDRDGRVANVVLGFPTLALYLADPAYLGASIGRLANRLKQGRFTLDGQSYEVPANNGDNALHGGPAGFDRMLWRARPIAHGVEFRLTSPSGDQGFPGTLDVLVRFTFAGAALRIDYEAACDRATVVNLTNHTYFNLAGEGNILGHQIEIPAEHFTPIDATLVPTGELRPVEGTPFDFRQMIAVGARIGADDEQMTLAGGYDHNWAFGRTGELKLAARVFEPASGRTLTVQMTEPGLQFYTGNFLDGSMPSRAGGMYTRRTGLCLETQHYPDSPNQPAFPSVTLRPAETMRSATVFTFSVEAPQKG